VPASTSVSSGNSQRRARGPRDCGSSGTGVVAALQRRDPLRRRRCADAVRVEFWARPARPRCCTPRGLGRANRRTSSWRSGVSTPAPPMARSRPANELLINRRSVDAEQVGSPRDVNRSLTSHGDGWPLDSAHAERLRVQGHEHIPPRPAQAQRRTSGVEGLRHARAVAQPKRQSRGRGDAARKACATYAGPRCDPRRAKPLVAVRRSRSQELRRLPNQDHPRNPACTARADGVSRSRHEVDRFGAAELGPARINPATQRNG
jgi:hypothetical protein